MKVMTPPKLIPLFQRTAASGTLPIEQTKLTTAMSGPTSGPQILARRGWSVRKKCCQKLSGTQAPMAPAMSRSRMMSRSTATHSMTKMWLTAVNPLEEGEPPPERAGLLDAHVHRGVALHRSGQPALRLPAGLLHQGWS